LEVNPTLSIIILKIVKHLLQ